MGEGKRKGGTSSSFQLNIAEKTRRNVKTKTQFKETLDNYPTHRQILKEAHKTSKLMTPKKASKSQAKNPKKNMENSSEFPAGVGSKRKGKKKEGECKRS